MKIEEHIGWADMMVYTHECPKCGTESDVHIGEDADATEKPRYCPACGEPIRMGDVVNVDGDAMTVLGYRRDDTLLLIAKDRKSGLFFSPEPSRVRHFKLEPPDSWEKLEEDVNLGCRDYCEKYRLEECDYNMRVHMLDRAKKLAGIEDPEGGER